MTELQERYKGHKLVIFSAPSGSGKTTIARGLLKSDPRLEFSISATSREPRGEEKEGVDYFYMTQEDFLKGINTGKFVEWEEVYNGALYGTLVSEVEKLWGNGKVIVFDVDVMGGLRLKKIFGDSAMSVFIMPPSIEELRRRLVNRGTDSADKIEKRVGRAQFEIDHAKEFDKIIINDDLSSAISEVSRIVDEFIKQ